MVYFKTVSDKEKIQKEMPFDKRIADSTMHAFLSRTVNKFPNRPALSFQIKSGTKDYAETYTWSQLLRAVTQAANAFRSLGINSSDSVAYVLPNCNEAVISFIGGVCAGIVCPISPLLGSDQMAGILREIDAKVVVTLAPFPKTDVAQKVDEAVKLAPNVKTVLEVDLRKYLTPPLSWIIPLIRPKFARSHDAEVMSFADVLNEQSGEKLSFDDDSKDRIGAFFHTGGTTGMPKVAQHSISGMFYQGWGTTRAMSSWSEKECVICPLPMFHVLAVYPMLMTCIASGSHIVFPTPQGYRGDGVFDNFWKLVERWNATFMVMVPTAATALMQRSINANVSSLKYAICGSSPLPAELFNRFESATGLKIIEGYGMTEAVCLISVNPPEGERKIGSVGIPFPYTDLSIMHFSDKGKTLKTCKKNEVGEICIKSPGVQKDKVYTQDNKNMDVYASNKYMRTGDLGYLDNDGYLWITGRAKDIIIRGGHNIDPNVIEDALAGHNQVAMVGAIGQPDLRLGEVPCAYVELVDGATAEPPELMEHVKKVLDSKVTIPEHIEILDELPKTAVGKIFKPDLRKKAIERIFTAELQANKIDEIITDVVEDKVNGLTAVVSANSSTSDEKVNELLGQFIFPWKRKSNN